MSRSAPWSVSHQARRVRVTMSVLAALAVLPELAAGTGLAIVAGISRVQQVLAHFDWAWLPVPVSLAALPTLRKMNAATHQRGWH